MASDPSNKAQGNANGYIKTDDIKVRPDFPTNAGLAKSICGELNGYIEVPPDHESRRILHPNLLVFRPSGRAGDEFDDQVSKELTAGDKTYLIIASSTKPTDMFHIHEDDLKKLQDLQTRIVINTGRLVTSSENHYGHNTRSLRKLAEDICEKYKVRLYTSDNVNCCQRCLSCFYHSSSLLCRRIFQSFHNCLRHGNND